ncbi:MAG: DUF58 domain-containing protein [bacterium]|nr:DUF58 domain-containing protein [bacterium]
MKLFIALLVAAVLYYLQYKLYSRMWSRNLQITIDFQQHIVEAGERNVLIETIENQKWLPLPILQIKFAATKTFLFPKEETSAVTDQYYRNEFFSVLSYQKIVRELPFLCSKRGCYSVSDMDVIAKDLFLTGKMLAHLEHHETVCVLPRKIPVTQIPFSMDVLFGDVVRKSHIHEDPFEFAGIREYQPYDSMHSINWKNTAKSGILQVNTYHTTFSQEVHIFLNIDANTVARADQLCEEAIRVADAAANRLLMEHVPIGFYTNGRDQFTDELFETAAGAGSNHIRKIEMALARIDLSRQKADFSKLLKEKTAELDPHAKILLISNYRKEDVMRVYESLCAAGYSCAWIVPEFYDVEPEEQVMSLPHVQKWEAAYEG